MYEILLMVVVCSIAGRMRRKKVRLVAAAMFEQDMKPVQVAHELRVSTNSRLSVAAALAGRRHGGAGLEGAGRGGICRLGPAQLSPGC